MKQALILIVDDNSDSRLVIKAALRKYHHSFLEAQDGQEGIQLAKEHNPDLIIMDVMMPVLDGYEALFLLKKDPSTKHIPVLIVTAMASMDEKIIALEAGAEGLWSKPFDRVDLISQVEMLIGLHQQTCDKECINIEQKDVLDKVFHIVVNMKHLAQ